MWMECTTREWSLKWKILCQNPCKTGQARPKIFQGNINFQNIFLLHFTLKFAILIYDIWHNFWKQIIITIIIIIIIMIIMMIIIVIISCLKEWNNLKIQRKINYAAIIDNNNHNITK